LNSEVAKEKNVIDGNYIGDFVYTQKDFEKCHFANSSF